jgi:glycosyltransferase involved in cell wall biosynthesis
MTEIDPAEPAVVVAYVHSNNITYSWHHSMIELVGWDLANHCRIIRGGYIAIRAGTDGMTLARNKAVKQFLAEKQAEWLFWIDTDMGFPPDTVDRLLEAADPVERPVVGALCFAQEEHTDDGLGGFRCRAIPTIYDWVNTGEQMGFGVRWQYPLDTLTRVGATGSACVLIHRSVFEKIAERYGLAWYDRVPNTTTGQVLGEDFSFCLRAGTLQIPVHVHTGVKATHLKHLWLAEEDYWRQVAMDAQRAGFGPAVAPPATEPTAVIVPVLNRPRNAAPFMDSLRASTGLATVYAVADADDKETIRAWERVGATVLIRPGIGRVGTFAQKVNHGYRHTSQPWLFLTGDDVRFRPGWLDQAQATAGAKFNVVGTNDLGNPRVTSGEHATHLLVRRSYVDEQGASWDGPGVVAHEGYRHWFVDDEIVTVAKQRGTWAPSLAAVVEHLHPIFGKAESDPTYRLGQSFIEQDRALFEQRMAEHAS